VEVMMKIQVRMTMMGKKEKNILPKIPKMEFLPKGFHRMRKKMRKMRIVTVESMIDRFQFGQEVDVQKICH
jgi:hypothetical protein